MITAFSLLLIFLAAITFLTSEIGWSNITLAKRNNIVFENKNQKYGAYSIRAAYNDHMMIALGIMFLVVMAFFSGNLIWKNLFKEKPTVEIKQEPGVLMEILPTVVDVPKMEEKARAEVAEQKSDAATDKWTTIEITDNKNDNPPAQNNIGNVGVEKKDGDNKPTILENPGPPSPGITTNEVIDFAEVSPMFPNGDAAMMAYLSKNIKYPEDAKDGEIQGTVYLSFVVSSNGDIIDVEEIKGVRGGSSLTREAIRVVSGMPKWIPGRMGGKAVNVRFRLPVRFVLN